MPQVDRVKTVTSTDPMLRTRRTFCVSIRGKVNKPEWPARNIPSPLELIIGDTVGQVCEYRSGLYRNGEDALNTRPMYDAENQAWSTRLYATAYAKFANAARQGSAEWGMNIVQGREALRTLVQLAQTSANVVTAFVNANRRSLVYLRKKPNTTLNALAHLTKRRGRDLVRARTKRERLRLQREISLLEQVSGTILAYRYGVSPLMDDIFSTMSILSKPFDDDVSLRKSAKMPWKGDSHPWGRLYWSGTESVVLKATVSVSNPNLLLLNRLGIINPQMWLWDKTPWSFVVDWWLPVGTFLSNFTALAGLTLTGASVTRERSWTSTFIPPPEYHLVGSGRGMGKRKSRQVGSLPIPLTVPFGTGLGIQRGQNALALIAQKLTKGRV